MLAQVTKRWRLCLLFVLMLLVGAAAVWQSLLFVNKTRDDFKESSQPLTTLTSTPQPTGLDHTPSGFEKRWLQGIPCAPPCWEGITPGRSTLTEAVRLLQQSPAIQPQTVVFEPWGEDDENRGSIKWQWRGSKFGGHIYYYYFTQGEAIVTYIWPGLEAIPGADASFTLGEVIAAYGEPSHIHATGFYGRHGDGPFYTATFYYEKHGLALESAGLYHSKPTLGPGLQLDRVTFLIEPVQPQRPTFAGIPDDPDTGPQPWQGFKDFDVYCKDTSLGKNTTGRCPEPRLSSSPGLGLFYGLVVVSVLLAALWVGSRSRRRGPDMPVQEIPDVWRR